MAKNSELWQRKEEAVARGVGVMHQRFAKTAKNSELWDVEGSRYIDFATGIAVNNTGHSDPRVIEAVKAQLDRFSHSCFQVNPYESYIELAEKLNAAAPGNTPKKSLFLTTGAEAVENSIKIARASKERGGVISFSGGFHGRTMMGLALTGKVIPYKVGFGPFPGEIFHVPFPIDYHGVTEQMSLDAIDSLFKIDINPERVAAIIIEPVQGEAGFYVASPSFMKSIRRICDEHGILMIVDEIQTGFARTGRMFATEYSGVEPDLMTVAKAMAGGFPISGVVGKADIMDAAEPGGLGGTYGGSPMGCVAGLKIMEIIESDKLCQRANEIGDLFRTRLLKMKGCENSPIGDVRNLGAMIAIELVKEGAADKPDADLTVSVVKEAATRGLTLLKCGTRGNVIRFLPALSASDEILHEGLDILEGVLNDLT